MDSGCSASPCISPRCRSGLLGYDDEVNLGLGLGTDPAELSRTLAGLKAEGGGEAIPYSLPREAPANAATAVPCHRSSAVVVAVARKCGS